MSRGEVIERTHTFCMHALTVLSLANTDAHFGRVFYMHAKTHTGSSSWEIVHAFSFSFFLLGAGFAHSTFGDYLG